MEFSQANGQAASSAVLAVLHAGYMNLASSSSSLTVYLDTDIASRLEPGFFRS